MENYEETKQVLFEYFDRLYEEGNHPFYILEKAADCFYLYTKEEIGHFLKEWLKERKEVDL